MGGEEAPSFLSYSMRKCKTVSFTLYPNKEQSDLDTEAFIIFLFGLAYTTYLQSILQVQYLFLSDWEIFFLSILYREIYGKGRYCELS